LAVPLVGAAVAAAVMLASHHDAPPAAPETVRQTVLPAPAVVRPVEEPSQVGDTKPALVPSSPANESTRSPVAQRRKPVAVSAVASAAPVRGSVRPTGQTGNRGDLFATAEAAPQAPARAVQPEAAAPSEEPKAPAVVAPARQDDAALEREMGMLSVAQRVLQSDPERALKLARQGEAEFAGSMFTQERQQLLLLSLIKLGRVDEAKRLARTYLARYPHGPFTDRVRRSLLSGRVER